MKPKSLNFIIPLVIYPFRLLSNETIQDIHDKFEIIGNIYENTKLLNTKQ